MTFREAPRVIEGAFAAAAALWARLQGVSFLTDDEKRTAAGYAELGEGALAKHRPFEIGAKYAPDQPRVPAGQSGGGQWTSDGGGAGDTIFGGSSNDNLRNSGYPIDILEEDVLGGHTFARHINKPEEFLQARILENRGSISILGLELVAGEKRSGSFTSLEAANKLVNSVVAESQNQEKLKAFVEKRAGYLLPFMNLFPAEKFKSPTGYEAYAPNDRSKPYMRSTYSIQVRVRRTNKNSRGFYVDSAFPTNED